MRGPGNLTISSHIALARAVIPSKETQSLLAHSEAGMDASATRDPLTRALDRGALVSALLALERPALLVSCDVKGLGEFNTQFGSHAGDQRLRRVAAALASLIEPAELYRPSGDEFAWLVDPIPSDPAEDLHRLIEKCTVLTHQIQVRAGWVEVAPGAGALDALGQAAAAVAAAKSSGTVVGHFTAVDAATLARRQRLVRALDEALHHAQDQLHLEYQPIVRFADGVTVAVEALSRWEHPTLGVIAPDEFVGLAEQTGRSCELDEWVMRRALEQSSHLVGRPNLHINVSAMSLSTVGFTDVLLDLVGHSALDPTTLCIELTETALGSDASRLRHAVDTLHAEGIRITIDDFGTGHASWSYLKDLAIDELKIDKSYVRGIDTDPRQAAVVRAIVGVANAYGQEVVAEGVETQAQAQTLMDIGCGFGQGYLLGRAMPAPRNSTDTAKAIATQRTRPVRRSTSATTDELDASLQLTDLTRALSTANGNVDAVFRLCVKALRRSIDFDGGSLQLLGSDGVRIAAAAPPPTAEALAARLPEGRGVAGTVLSTGRPVYLPDITSNPAVPARRRAISGGVRSYLAVPLFRAGRTIGVLQIDSSHVDAFGPGDRLQLAAAAALVSVALGESADVHLSDLCK